MFKFTGFYLRTGLFWRPYLQGVKRDVEWLGLPYPPGRHLRCDPYRESLASLRAYYHNPHIITISQSYCSLCMPKARGACYESLERLIGISHKHWNHGKINGGQKRHYPFRHPKWRYPYLEGLSTRPPYSLTPLLLSSPQIHSHSNLANR